MSSLQNFVTYFWITRAQRAIYSSGLLAFVLALWLVRSQATVSGVSSMRAMIPHHSIVILTREFVHHRSQ